MLCAWYPFINDSHNQGLADADLSWTTAPTFSTGLIGGAMISNGTASISAAQNANIMNNSAISVCFWIYVDAPEGDTSKRATICGNEGGKRHYPIFQYPTCNDLHLSWYTYDSSWNGSAWSSGKVVADTVLTGVLPSYKWTHVAVTYDNPNVKVYVNGELKWSASGVMQSVSFADSTYYAYACTYRKICDLRVYNHCISPKEVKEISKGLVLHYPLSGSGGGCENLMKDSNFSITSGLNASTVKIATLIPVGTTITVSVQVDADDVVWDSSSNYRRVGTEFYAPKSGTTDNQYFGAWAGQELSSSGNVVEAFTGSFHGRVSKTFTTLGEVPALRNVGLYIQGVTSGTVRVSNPKVEIGSVATPWVPNAADTEYATMGFNDGIEYDVSGYGHNATKIGDITYTSNTPRYNVSTSINTNESYLVVSGLTTIGFSNSFSIAWWGNVSDFSNKMMWGFRDGIRLNGICNGNLWNTGDGSNNPIYQPGTTTKVTAPSVGVWHHYVMTGDGTNNYLYVDGVLYGESKTYKGISGTTIYFNGWTDSSDYRYADGLKLSDFRIYAIALSADDVKDLYHTPISLANNGTLLTQGEYVES